MPGWWTIAPIALVVAAALSAALILALFPLLRRYALARPNARSSHKVPTPQGGGIAVIVATLLATVLALLLANVPLLTLPLLSVAFPALVLACVGTVDDLKPVPVIPRLALQAAAVAAMIYALPERIDLLTFLPVWAEKALLVLAGVWLVNLTNFMDGLDWMMVAECVPLTAALTLIGLAGFLPQMATLLAAAMCGALIGFAPFNKPVARLFLGDVGSLPIGLLLLYLLVKLAVSGFIAAAILLPLYFIMDATLTLLRRLMAREAVWQAHRSHFYQRATDNGFAVGGVVSRVFALNVLLCALAGLSVALAMPVADIALIAIGLGATGLLLWRFNRPRALQPAST